MSTPSEGTQHEHDAPPPSQENVELSHSDSIQDSRMVSGKEADVEVIDDNDEEQGGPVGSKRKLTSVVWKEFKRVTVAGKIKAKCNWCNKSLGGDTRNGTRHLHDHLKVCVYRKSKMSPTHDQEGKHLSQTSLRFSCQEMGSLDNYTYDQEVARKELANMMVLHEYPLSMVDHAGFRRFVSALQPLFKMVTRNTIRKDIMDNYDKERRRAINYLCGSKARVAVTSDMWTSDNQKRGYMAITAHFIDDLWRVNSILMRFMYVPAPHTADVIAEELSEALVKWNLDEKLSTVTLDNCTTNDKVIDLLSDKLGASKLMLRGKVLHMRCCAHILNLIVKDGLTIIQSAIENIRDSVAYWTATPKRVEKFEDTAKYVKVAVTKKLALDCKTRWNSTFTMLSVAIPYKSVFNRLKKLDKQYESAPSEDEWEFATDVVERLRLFFDVTEIFSGTDYVTANIFFPKICEIKVSIRSWSTCGNPILEAMSERMKIKFDKYWLDIQGLMGIAILLDPRFKTEMLVVCFEMLLGTSGEECEEKVREVTKLLCELMIEYQVDCDEDIIESSVVVTPKEAPAALSILTARVAKKRPASLRLKSELDRYLEDDYVMATKDNFDVLSWWKVAGIRYPTLRMVARDIFAIPVTTVSSESAFSTGGRVLSAHRSRLTPDMLEALMCSQDWIRNRYKDQDRVSPTSFWTCLQDIHEGLESLGL